MPMPNANGLLVTVVVAIAIAVAAAVTQTTPPQSNWASQDIYTRRFDRSSGFQLDRRRPGSTSTIAFPLAIKTLSFLE